ncbi:unnamed protein product [Blepharisma stoltei]|uniref:Kinesin-like protein 6 n=1 Tax=Blepharisma stoltei TaxID=1481888 RepID=A0AAU9JLC6_9CILI|nr:unnamed protein product [Blepharisma stoltei]
MGDCSVKVAVRVRPFNSREKEEGAELCVEMRGNTTKVRNKENGTIKEFHYDYSYWSHDGFNEDPTTGILTKASPSSQYADQQTVFNDIGVGVLDNAWQGYHCCLFAYGQTGSGKSYSMVGYGSNKGIIPIACEEVFIRISQRASPFIECKVSASMLEIYNEQVQDLLQPPQNRVKGGLKIREDPKKGVFVEGLIEQPCSSYEEISAVLDRGNKSRTVAATQMNATSSRAHTVLTISFTQIFYDEATGKPLNRKQSNINLVDLAGSERAAKTGATGDRLQEGSNINKSLSSLGKVITALAKRSSGQLAKGEVIPYRESKLTRILQNALGGNSMTTMIAAISPATFNYDETISTLRYADAVKSIKNQAVVNETPQEKLIRELKEENERLKALVEGRGGGGGGGAGGGMSDQMREEYERQIEELRKAKEDAEKTREQRTQEVVHRAAFIEEKITTPHLSNLNEDPLLSGYIKHAFKKGTNVIGKKNPQSPPNITIEGLGIGINHCTVTYNDEIKLKPSTDPSLKTLVNGKVLTQEITLQHHDRIRFGNHNYFLFIDPDELGGAPFDWEKAVNEASQDQVNGLIGANNEEMKAKEEEMRRKLEAEWEEARKKMEDEKAQLEKMLKGKKNEDAATQKALFEKEQELKAKQRAMEEEMRKKEIMLKQHEENRLAMERLKKVLTQAITQINEANERAVLLGKSTIFQPELYRDNSLNSGRPGTGMQQTQVRVKVLIPDISDDFQIHWPLDKLEARLIDMQEISNQLEYGGDINDVDIGYDPFFDKVDSLGDTYKLIGNSYIYLDSIYYLITVDEDKVPIIDDRGSKKGMLKVAITPKIDGIVMEEFDNLKEILGKNLNLKVAIGEATDIPENFSTNCYCKYKFAVVSEEEYMTQKCMQTTVNPKFNYIRDHNIEITPEVADDFLHHALAISVYGDITEETKQRELNKLREKYGQASNPVKSARIKEFEEEPEILENDHPGYSEIYNNSKTIVPSENPEALKTALEQKELQIQKLKAENIKREQEYAIRLRELEEREKKASNQVPVAKRGSCACLIF